MTSRRNQTHDVRQAASQAAQLVSRQTCEGCQHLRALRPMCMSEASPHWRAPRATYQDRCTAYAVKGRQPPAQKPEQIVTSVPRPPETKRKRSYVTGDVSRRMY
jgi:hypothetical protein